MLWALFLVLLLLWLLAMATAYTAGGFIHLLLVIALVMMVVQSIDRPRVLEAELARGGKT